MQYFFKNSKIRMFLVLFLLLFFYTFLCAVSYVNAVSSHISDSVFRLHILANSNSEEDQNLKYLVRDEVISFLTKLTENVNSKKEVIQIVNKNLDQFQQIAEKVISENGYTYPVKISVGNFSFPTKEYGDVSLPAGSYDALRIEIGQATGNNWWCVLFPPLCFVDVSSGIVPDESKEIIKENLFDEEYSLITDDSNEVKFKFKIVEFFQNVGKQVTAKK